MQENLEEANDSPVVDFDTGITDRADVDRQRNPLQKREVDMNIEPLGLKASEAAGDDFERLADGIEIVQSLFEAEVVEVVGAKLIAQERCEFFVLLQEGMLEVGAEDMMAMLNLVDDGGELAGQPAVQARAEYLGNLVGCQPPQSELPAALEQFVDGKVPFEYEVAAIFDLGYGIEARQLYPLALLDGELGPEDQGPIVEPFANDVGAQLVGGGLERSDVVNRQEGIVVLAEADLRTIELLLDEAVAVEVIVWNGKKVATRITMGPRTSSRM